MPETRKAEVSYYRVRCVPFKDAPRDKIQILTVKAWSPQNAVEIACQQLDIHPKNYGFSTDMLAPVLGEEGEEK